MRSSFFRLSILFSFCIFLFSTSAAYAHFPATDGDMTVTLHVDPNDDPVPGKQAHLYFLFDDTSKKFKLSDCTCTVAITEFEKQTFKKQLIDTPNSKPSIWGASMPYIFPERNVYHIVLTGDPNTENTFRPFTVSWYFRVDATNPGLVQVRQGPADSEVLFSAFGIVSLGLIIFVFFIKKEFGH